MKKGLALSIISIFVVLTIVFGMLYFTTDAKQTKQIADLTTETADQKNQINTLTGDVSDKSGQIEALTAESATQKEQIESLTSEVTDKAEQIKTITAESTEQKGQIESLTAEVTDQAGQIEALTAESAAQKEQIESLTSEVTDKAEQIKTITAESTEQKEQIESLTAEVTDQAGQIEALTTESENQKKNIESLSADVTFKASQIEALTAESEKQKKSIESLSADVAFKAGQIETLTLETEEQKKQIETFTIDAVNKTTQIKTLTAKTAEQKVQIETLTGDAALKADQIEKLTAENDEQKSQIDTLTADAADKQAKMKELTEDNTSKADRITELTKESEEQNLAIKLLIMENSNAADRITELNEESEEQKKKIEELTEDNTSKADLISDLTVESERQKKNIEDLKTDIADKEEQINTLSNTVKEQAGRIDTLTAQIDKLQSSVNTAAAEEDYTETPILGTSDWYKYDNMISEIKSTTDFARRSKLMHQAEDILMATGAIIPIYYYNDVYMAREGLTGYYSNAYATKYFMYADFGDNKDLRLQLASEPEKLDPALNSSVDGACLAVNSFGGLYTYDASGNFAPNFATGYEVSEDGLTYTFTIRDGLKWSDGTDLTARDFEYSWKRAASSKTAADYSYMFDGIAGYPDDLQAIASEDGKTFTVTLNAPCAYMLDLTAFPTFFPVQQACVEAKATADNPGAWAAEAGFVSSGAFVLEYWEHDRFMVYVKNPYYWDAENVKLERLAFALSDDDTAMFAAYRNGDLDFIDSVPNDQIESLKSNPEFHIVDELGTYYAIFNVKSDLFAGKTVEQAAAMRRALGLLIDRQYIIDTIGQTGQKVATSFIPAGMLNGNGGIFKDASGWNYPNGEDGYFPVEPDVDQAIELLKSAGFEFDASNKLSAATPISFEYLTNTSSGHIAIAECIQQDFAQIGVNMTIKDIDWAVFLNKRKEGNFGIARNGWIADFNDPINMLEMWTTVSGNNDAQFGR